MTNIIKYVDEYGDLDFLSFPLNSVDMLIFSEISYWAFEKSPLNDGYFSCAFKELNKFYLRESLTKNRWFPEKDKQLYDLITSKQRFSNIKIKYFKDIIDTDIFTQFSALTFEISNELSVIAYRGTDTSYTGWIEDFTLSFNETMPSHKHSLEYLEEIIEKDMKRKYILVGHSKGGNLATYAFVKCKYPDKITNIYDFDGPGFHKIFFELEEFNIRKNIIKKIIPATSIVGMLLENRVNILVVQSNATLFSQHDPFQFRIENGNFIELEDVNDISKYLKKTIDIWLKKYDDKEKKELVKAIFTLITSSNAKDIKALSDNWLKHIYDISSSIIDQNQEEYNILSKAIKGYLETVKNELSSSFKNDEES